MPHGKRSEITRAICLSMAIVLALDPSRTFGAPAQEPAAPSGGSPQAKNASDAGSPEARERAAAEMARAFEALEELSREMPRETFEAAAVVRQVGGEPKALLAWVRDHTFWVPYRGALRGPAGVLMDRLGNSLDRASLLAELLRAAGRNARLARAELNEAAARELLAKWPPPPRDPLSPAAPARDLEGLIGRIAAKHRLDADVLQNQVNQMSLSAERMAEEALQRTEAQAPAIAESVGKPAEDAAAAARARTAQGWLDALRDHWWVQLKDGDAWVDLDPLLGGAQPGLTGAPETIEPDATTGRIAPPEKDCHRLGIRVVIEQATPQGLKEKAVLERSLRPAELLGRSISLGHIAMDWPRDLDLFREKDPLRKVREVVLAQGEWAPALRVGSEVFTDQSFTDSGDSGPADLAGLAADWGFKKAGGNVADFLRTGRIGAGAQKGEARGRERPGRSAGGTLTAEWIEFEVHTPGESVQTIRRQVFDLLGPAARAAGKGLEARPGEDQRYLRGLLLLGSTEVFSQVCELSPEFIADQSARHLLSLRQALIELVRRGAPPEKEEKGPGTVRDAPPPAPLYELARARRLWSRGRSETFLGRQSIFALHSAFRQGPGGELLACRGIDIIAHQVSLRPGSSADPFLAQLGQGVLDTNVEALLLSGCARAQNAAELFAASSARGVEWLAIASAADRDFQAAALPPDFRSRVEQDLAAGSAVIVPASGVEWMGRGSFGWWQVDRTTGETLGRGEDGWGQASTEKVFLEGLALSMAGGGLCLVAATIGDPKGLSRRDVYVCALFAAGGFAPPVGIALAGTSGVAMMGGIMALVAYIAAMLGTGVWLNNNQSLDDPIFGGTPPAGSTASAGAAAASPSASSSPASTSTASPSATSKPSPSTTPTSRSSPASTPTSKPSPSATPTSGPSRNSSSSSASGASSPSSSPRASPTPSARTSPTPKIRPIKANPTPDPAPK